MVKINIKNIAIFIVIVFILSVPYMVTQSYNDGVIHGADEERIMIELELSTGATYDFECHLENFSLVYIENGQVKDGHSQYKVCNGVWNYSYASE